MRPLYIFDLDGTLALIEHRRHFVTKDEAKQERTLDWQSFYKACVDDVPNIPVIDTLRRLAFSGAEIWIFSGRSDEVKNETQTWLNLHVGEPYLIEMRRAGDFTPDDKLKKQWLDNMLDVDLERLVAVFEDRDRMVAMWRSEGIACFQVASGEF